jgi:hypothetical protein
MHWEIHRHEKQVNIFRHLGCRYSSDLKQCQQQYYIRLQTTIFRVVSALPLPWGCVLTNSAHRSVPQSQVRPRYHPVDATCGCFAQRPARAHARTHTHTHTHTHTRAYTIFVCSANTLMHSMDRRGTCAPSASRPTSCGFMGTCQQITKS